MRGVLTANSMICVWTVSYTHLVSPTLVFKERTFGNVRISFDVKMEDVALAENWAGAFFHSKGMKGFWEDAGYLAVSYTHLSSEAILANQVKLLPVEFTLDAYEYVMKNGKFWTAALISLERVIIGVPVSLALTIMAAYPLSKAELQFPARKWYVAYFIAVSYTHLVKFWMNPFLRERRMRPPRCMSRTGIAMRKRTSGMLCAMAWKRNADRRKVRTLWCCSF